MKDLYFYTVRNFQTSNGLVLEEIQLSYQLFGRELHTAPIVLVNHALTGNSDLNSPERGWWKDIIGDGKLIDTRKFTVIAFNIPGNGYDGHFIEDYKLFTAKDIAVLFSLTLQGLKIDHLYAAIGGSIGGGIAWEMAALAPKYIKYLIPIAAHWKSSDWIIGHNAIQESILLNSKKPLQDARKMAMLFYRTPASFTKKFNRTKTEDKSQYNVVSWLNHHGKKLESRFHLKSYLLMNHLLTTLNIQGEQDAVEEILQPIEAEIIQIAVDSDLFFVRDEALKTKTILDQLKVKNQYHEIKSLDGHDAFLIEHEQLTQFLKPIFNQ